MTLQSAIDAHPQLWAAMVDAHAQHKAHPLSRFAAVRAATFVEALTLVGRFRQVDVLARLDEEAAR